LNKFIKFAERSSIFSAVLAPAARQLPERRAGEISVTMKKVIKMKALPH
jgi:hypothetical protein